MMRTSLSLLGLVLLASNARAQCVSATQRLLMERKYEDAKKELLAVLSRTPDDDAAHECLGRLNVEAGRPREAVGQFERAIKLNDQVASHHLWLANALGSLADSVNKIKLPFHARRIKSEFERAVALDPTSIDGRHGLIQFYSQAPSVMGGSMDKAREQVREIARLNPMRGHYEAGQLFAREKNIADAEKEVLAARKSAPDSAVAAYWVGSFYQGQERWDDAFAVYDAMQRQFPDEGAVRFQIGRTAAVSGLQLDRGEKELKLYITSPPKGALNVTIGGAHHRLGMIYEKQGKKELARAEYQLAVELSPGNEAAKKSLAALPR